MKPEAARDLGRIGLVLLQYAVDANDALPPMGDTDTVAKATKDYYARDEAIFFNSHTGQKYQPNTSLSHRKLNTLEAGGIVLFYESLPSSANKRLVLVLLTKTDDVYDDSQVSWVRQVDEKEWEELKLVSGIH